MRSDIAENGPISCGIEVTPKFLNYTGGIYSERLDNPMLNHEISVVGYGKDAATGDQYWIGRNSWGTYWGESGFFRMATGDNGLGIETDCSAGIPSFKHPSEREEVQYIV